MTRNASRRDFTKTMFIAGVAGCLRLPEARAAAPGERLRLGFIGVGKMGEGHLGGFLGMPDVEVLAVCDVVKERREHARARVEKHAADKRKQGAFPGCKEYLDYRELLARDDLDAVLIATPDHWHALNAVHAARAKKHIYCEKPLTRTIGEGRRLVTEVAKAGIVFQTGSQQRTEFGGHFRDAVDFVRNGRIGKVKAARIGVGDPAKKCDLPGEAVPPGTDWERWVGPAEFRPYNQILCPKGMHKHFPAWRAYQEYAGGGLADMGAHHFDIAQWALGMDGSGPVTIEPPAGDARKGLKFTYANGITMTHGGEDDCVLEGELGTIFAARRHLKSKPEKLVTEPLPVDARRVPRAASHKRDWLDAIRQGRQGICTAEIGHRSASICHLANLGYRLRRKLTWDPVAERFAGDAEANALIDPAPRSPWNF